MQTEEIYFVLNDVFRDVFDDASLQVTADTVAADVSGWDSMNHIQLIVATEARLGIRFKTSELESLKNVGELAEIIGKRLSGK
jgi:acyl carrier protein